MINWDKIYASIPEVTGLPFTLRGSRWYGAFRLSGEKHHRWDKTNCRVTSDGKILIGENGGSVMSLVSWLMQYGGFSDYNTAMQYLEGKTCENVKIAQIAHEKTASEQRYISWSDMEATTCTLQRDNLYVFLVGVFGKDRVDNTWRKYHIGVRDNLETVFWYIDGRGRILHDKFILYGNNGKRRKDIDFSMGRKYKVRYGYMGKCYFGEHLIGTEGAKKVMVVESEKTALICDIVYPNRIWVATGGKTSGLPKLNGAKYLPDVDAWDAWVLVYGRDACTKWWEELGWAEFGEKSDIADYLLEKNLFN